MKKTILPFLLLLSSLVSYSQNYSEYERIRNDAISAFDNHDYFKALQKFNLIKTGAVQAPSDNDAEFWTDSCIILINDLMSPV